MVIIAMKSDKKILHAFRWAVGHINKGQAEIGAILGVKQPAVSLLLGDKREVKQCHINALAEDMGITPEELMERACRWAQVSATLPTVTAQATAHENVHPIPRRRAIEFRDREQGEVAMEALAEIELLDPGEFRILTDYIMTRRRILRDNSSPAKPRQESSSAS
jgi:hypothetical protein